MNGAGFHVGIGGGETRGKVRGDGENFGRAENFLFCVGSRRGPGADFARKNDGVDFEFPARQTLCQVARVALDSDTNCADACQLRSRLRSLEIFGLDMKRTSIDQSSQDAY